jgi:hypothetical protein
LLTKLTNFGERRALAELLGQVKPTVASKEDIENSGLEVVKVPSGSKGAAKMKELEEEGKIAGNTVDRVRSHSPILILHVC